MPPLAICSNADCGFVIELHDYIQGRAVATPDSCPQCRGAVLSICPMCRFLLFGMAKENLRECPLCRVDVRGAYAQRLQDRMTSQTPV